MRKGKTGSQIARQQYRKGNINNERKKEGNIGNKKQKWSHEPGLIPGAVTPCSYLQNVETGTGAQKTAFAISKRGGGGFPGTKRPGLQSDYFPLSGAPLIRFRCMKKETSTFVRINPPHHNCCIHSLIGNATGMTYGTLLVVDKATRTRHNSINTQVQVVLNDVWVRAAGCHNQTLL